SDNLLRATSFFECKGIDGEFDYKRRRWMLDAVKEHISKFSSMRVIYSGYGFRPCTPDQVPVIGRVPGYSNLFIAGGQCRSGVTLAPLTGKIISSLIEGKKPSIKHLEKMSPKRFVG
ncbi:MAG: FAD-binding oxidoreductase, partial [Candidatus Micrarchaeota archaeon]|nr:FAD-binding oxidoreductase [Candidatus Micrarchaeota archaeon]